MSYARIQSADLTRPAQAPDATIRTALVSHPVTIELSADASGAPGASTTPPTDCGAECLFLGITRQEQHPRFGRLIRLDYQAYEPMAERVLRELALEAVARFGCRSVLLEHAVGPVEVGQASVLIRVTTPHRAAAFEACRWLIDTLKEKLPVWKREVWEDGRTYVEGQPVHAAPRMFPD